MAYVIAVANHKGGVAKTTSVAALGSAFSSRGYKVLMVDFDAQANLSFTFLGVKERQTRYLYHAIHDRDNLPQIKLRDNLYICPNGLPMKIVKAEMYNARRREYIIRDLIRPVRDNYDFILFDLPPTSDLLTDNAFAVADRVVVPVMSNAQCYHGLLELNSLLEENRDLNESLQVDDVFFTLFEEKPKISRKYFAEIKNEFPEATLSTVIHKTVKASESYDDNKSIIDYLPGSVIAMEYESLADELLDRIKKSLDNR